MIRTSPRWKAEEPPDIILDSYDNILVGVGIILRRFMACPKLHCLPEQLMSHGNVIGFYPSRLSPTGPDYFHPVRYIALRHDDIYGRFVPV